MLTCLAMPGPFPRALISAGLVSLWLLLLMIGWTLGGAVYLLLAVSLVLFPWKQTFAR